MRSSEMANICDVCGEPAPHCRGGEEYYCDLHWQALDNLEVS